MPIVALKADGHSMERLKAFIHSLFHGPPDMERNHSSLCCKHLGSILHGLVFLNRKETSPIIF